MDHRNELVVRRSRRSCSTCSTRYRTYVWPYRNVTTSACSNTKLSVFAPSAHVAGAGYKVISKQRPAARAVDQDVSRLEHRRSRPPRQGGRGPLHRSRVARIDQIAEGAFDLVERAEPLCPSTQQRHQVGRDGLPEREALRQLPWIEDGLDVVAIEVVGPVGLDRVRDQVRGEPDHPRTRVLATLLVEAHGETTQRLEQRRQQQTDGSCAEDVHSAPGMRSSQGSRNRTAGPSASSGQPLVAAGPESTSPECAARCDAPLKSRQMPGPSGRSRRPATQPPAPALPPGEASAPRGRSPGAGSATCPRRAA